MKKINIDTFKKETKKLSQKFEELTEDDLLQVNGGANNIDPLLCPYCGKRGDNIAVLPWIGGVVYICINCNKGWY